MINERILDFLKSKPEVIDVIGYGSGVKEQTGYNKSTKKQIDLILTVNTAYQWHKNNFIMYPEEYSNMGFKLIKHINNFGTDINYISNINYKEDTFKIGIIEKEFLLSDLDSWSNFYMAGRCQKPISLIKSDDVLNNSIKKNRLNALKVALLLNDSNIITERDLYETICSLSYTGDIRMTFHCENPMKIRNIVNGSYNEFKNIYDSVNNDIYYSIENNHVFYDYDLIRSEIESFPSDLLDYLNKHMDVMNGNIEELNYHIKNYLKMTNLKSSIAQPIKSFSINGVNKSLNYLKEKRKKGKVLVK